MMSFSRFPFSSSLRLIPLVLALTLAGCGSLVHTPYEAPKTDTPAHWAQRTTAADMRTDQWWKAFGDVELNRLIDEALARNNDLAVATIKVRSAQLAAGLAADARIPALGADLSTSGNKQLRNSRTLTKTSSATVSLSYEADLWGRLGSTYDAKRWEALATEQDRQSTALTLIGTTADLYWTGAYLNQRLNLNEQSIAYAQKTLDLVRTQYQAGGASYVDVLTSEQNLLTQQSARTQLLQQQVENNNALAILFDSAPGKTFALPSRLPTFALPVLAAGLPAELLGRRPDLRAAELRLRSYLADVDATRASYYPKLTLTGSVGGSSAALRDVLLNPIAALGAGLTLPFLQWNEMQLNVKVSQATYESAVVSFRQTLYSAFSDVENALSARQQYEAQELLLARNLQAAQEAERRYEIRYRAGYSPLKDWLDAQESRRTAEISLAEVRLNRLKNQMTLYQAIGGDMQGDETQAESAAGMSRPAS